MEDEQAPQDQSPQDAFVEPATPPPPASARPSTSQSTPEPESGSFSQRSYPHQPSAPDQPAAPPHTAAPQHAAAPQHGGFSQQEYYAQQPAYPEQDKGRVGCLVAAIVAFFVLLAGGVLIAIAAVRGADEVAIDAGSEVEDSVDAPDGSDEADTSDAGVGSEGDDDLPLGTFVDPVQEDTTAIAVADGELEQFDGEIAMNGFDLFEIDLEPGDGVVVSVEANQLTLDTLLRVVGPCLLYTSPSPRDQRGSRMPSSA